MSYFKSKEELINFFEENYYKTINYNDYTLRSEKYKSTAFDLINFLNISKEDIILDYGCAVGHLLNGFISYGIKNVYGFDISKWAIEKATQNNLKVSLNPIILSDKKYKLITALDVFEHMFDDDIDITLKRFNTDLLVIRIPVKLEGGNDFYLEVSRKDPSHVNCKTKEEWIEKFKSLNFEFINELTTPSIYDAPGCFCGYFKKIN